MLIKRTYVAAVRAVRPLVRWSGLLAWLERRRHRRWALYVRSLFSIYDAEDLASLDLPWWTFAAIDEVERFLTARHASAFEYGTGASTVWLARRCARVVAVEHDADFAAAFRHVLEPFANAELRVVTPEPVGPATTARSTRSGHRHLGFDSYAASIREAGGAFDLIVIDGRARAACLAEAQRHVKPDGIIVLDNSSRHEYQAALSRVPLDAVRYRGLTPCLPFVGETTLLRPRQGGAEHGETAHAVSQRGCLS